MFQEDVREVYRIARMIAKEEIAIALKAKVEELQTPVIEPDPEPTPFKK